MAKQVTAFDLAALAVDPTEATSRYTQIYRFLLPGYLPRISTSTSITDNITDQQG